MKQLLTLFSTRTLGFCAAFMLLCAWPLVPARAQQKDMAAQTVALRRVSQSLDRVVRKAKGVTDKTDFGFNEGACVFGAMIAPGSSVSETLPLKAGISYIFGSAGDDSTTNVDIFISDSAGRVVEKDNASDLFAVALFTPKKSGNYKMTLRLAAAKSGKAFCSAIVLRKGGIKIPLERIQQAETKAGVALVIVFGLAQGGQFNQDRNTWALHGVVLNSKQTTQSDYKRYEARNRAFFVVGDNRIKDLDFYLRDGNKKIVASDTKGGDYPSFAYQTKAGNYSISIHNNYSTGPSLIMGVLIDLPAGFDIEAAAKKLEEQIKVAGNKTNVSPVAGSWRGQWADDDGLQSGTISFNINNAGALNGQLYNSAVNATVPIAGTIKPDGTFFFKYSYASVSYLAKGQFQADGQTLAGRAGFSSDGQTFFGGGSFQLERQ